MSCFYESPWQLIKLGSVCGDKENADPTRSPNQEFFYVDIASVSNDSFSVTSPKRLSGSNAPSRARKRIRRGDVIVATTRPYLKSIAQVPDALDGEVCSTGFCVLRPTEQVTSDWLFYCTLSGDFIGQLTACMRGATYPAVTDNNVMESLIPLPPVSDQIRIVSRIKECLERVEEIEALRYQAVREAASIEFACFHDALIEGVQALGWPIRTLGDVAKSFRYGTSTKAHTIADGLPVLRMGNLQGGSLDLSNLKYINLPRVEVARYKLNVGDVLINRTNSLELVGKAATFDIDEGDWVYASYLVRVEVDRERAMPEFATAVINSRLGRDYVLRTARRAIGMVNLNAKEMARFPMPMPSLIEQQKVVARLREARPLAIELRTLMNEPETGFLRQSILRKAFAGEL